MRMYFPLLLALLLIFPSPSSAKDPIRIFSDCVVVKISDGDTLIATCAETKAKVRLYGIDAPEASKISRKTGRVSKPGQPYGLEAQKALETKVIGRKVKIVVMDVDRYRRLVSLVSLSDSNRDINREMVAEGWAWAYRQYLARPYKSEFINLEESARAAGKGLWQQSNPQPPWEFRRDR